jgi:hypothetical protein
LIGEKGPGQNNFDLTLPLKHPASSLPINNKSPNDSKRLLAFDIKGGGKDQDNISTFHPVHRNNDEYERNGNNIANSNVNIEARITNTEQSAQQKHSQGNFIKSGTNEKQQVSSKRVSRSIRYHPPPTDWLFSYFEDPCRRFVFAPACRGVTSKRSLGPGIGGAPIAAASAGTSLPLTFQPSSDDDIEKIKLVEPDNDHEADANKQLSQEDILFEEPTPIGRGIGFESNPYNKKKRSLSDGAYTPLDSTKRQDALDTFSSFYSPLKKRSDKNLLNSFSSFYSKRNSMDEKRASALDSCSSFYNPGHKS